jgi:hypothetical protein
MTLPQQSNGLQRETVTPEAMGMGKCSINRKGRKVEPLERWCHCCLVKASPQQSNFPCHPWIVRSSPPFLPSSVRLSAV